jgi:phenylpyruvate tautomerase PptA (4-oxalocrotonate tautomerase family)
MPVVTVEWYAGRSPEKKAEVADRLVKAFDESGIATDQLWIKFIDIPKENWVVNGEYQG